MSGAAAVLSRYPEDVVRRICHPVEGLPRTNKWLPSLAEIAEACDNAVAKTTPSDQVEAYSGGPVSNRRIDYDHEPWLRDAKREILPDGRCIIPGREIDRCYREWLARKRPAPVEPTDCRDWAKSQEEALERLEALQDRYADEPLKASDALRDRFAAPNLAAG